MEATTASRRPVRGRVGERGAGPPARGGPRSAGLEARLRLIRRCVCENAILSVQVGPASVAARRSGNGR